VKLATLFLVGFTALAGPLEGQQLTFKNRVAWRLVQSTLPVDPALKATYDEAGRALRNVLFGDLATGSSDLTVRMQESTAKCYSRRQWRSTVQ
jgi:hypothetical protein